MSVGIHSGNLLTDRLLRVGFATAAVQHCVSVVTDRAPQFAIGRPAKRATTSLQIRLPVAKPGQRGARGHFLAALIGKLGGLELAVFQRSWFRLVLFGSRRTVWHGGRVAQKRRAGERKFERQAGRCQW